ncbi:hypothetical protein GcM1_236023 [Golovinomyces cichoracearum]|uniref:Uncharacterized protein n=1 Tax=Golovinomyces cichoracearum TaxID=62708 RepID=A0A420IKB9_9PEZI|nr:hypothetical protein GcM1_236023 [Golovinomyces cichoracearum]
MKMSLGGVAAGRRCSTEKCPGVTYSMSNDVSTLQMFLRRGALMKGGQVSENLNLKPRNEFSAHEHRKMYL